MTDQWARTEALAIRDRLRAEHDRYKDLVSFLPTGKLRIQEDSRRYLCLRCAGFLEKMVFLTVNYYLSKKSSGPVLAFSTSYFRQAPNLTPDALRKLFARFGEQDLQRLDKFIDTSRRDILSDLLSTRNPVAHGDLVGGAKVDPTRYIEFCEDFYNWCIDNYLTD